MTASDKCANKTSPRAKLTGRAFVLIPTQTGCRIAGGKSPVQRRSLRARWLSPSRSVLLHAAFRILLDAAMLSSAMVNNWSRRGAVRRQNSWSFRATSSAAWSDASPTAASGWE